MTKPVKMFVLGFITAWLITTPLSAFADTIQVSLNSVHIDLNGAMVAVKGQSYALGNGAVTPFSLNYNGTVYLPVRKLSEMLGMNISYNGASSTISISSRNTPQKPPVNPDQTGTEKPENTDTPDTAGTPSGTEGGGTNNNADNKYSYAVINQFLSVPDGSQSVNELSGYVDGGMCDMLTAQSGMLSYPKVRPALFRIKYTDYIITEIQELPLKADTVKTAPNTAKKIIGDKETYTMDSNAIVYALIKGGGGSYAGFTAGDFNAIDEGCKVYLYDTDGNKGYDTLIYETAE